MHTLRPEAKAAAVLAVLLLPAVAPAAEPVNEPPPVAAVPQEVESLIVPAPPLGVEADAPRFDVTSLAPETVPADHEHRGGVLTNAARTLPAVTAVERAKLDAARAAVEASRAAGTLFVTHLPVETPRATPDELAAMKLQQLSARETVAPAPDPIAGVGVDLPAVQEIGPAGLTPAEEAKLRGGILPLSPAPPASDVTERGASATGDGAPVVTPAPATDAKESRNE